MTARGRIGLVGCVKSKGTVSAPARDLYTSPLFQGRRRWVERTCDRWFVLSALHGLVEPHHELAPYDKTLKDASDSERRSWSERVLRSLRDTLGDCSGLEFEIHAGREYAEFGLEIGLLAAGATVVRPAKGLGLFEQISFYRGAHDRLVDDGSTREREGTTPGSASPIGGKYAPLRERLASIAGPVEMTFEQIEALVGSLPNSARRHRPWWANDPSHSQARAWLSLGRKVEGVDLSVGWVLFGALPRV